MIVGMFIQSVVVAWHVMGQTLPGNTMGVKSAVQPFVELQLVIAK